MMTLYIDAPIRPYDQRLDVFCYEQVKHIQGGCLEVLVANSNR